MQFKDAAYEILKKANQSLHYNEITKRALEAGILDTAGKTPEASMGALLYTDTLNPESRFRRGDEKGTFTIKGKVPVGIEQQINAIHAQVRHDLKAYLHKMHPQKFESLIRALLVEMGFEEAETTSYSSDKGIDVRGLLRVDQLRTIHVAIQAKRWSKNVGSEVIQNVRGSLIFTDAEQGIVITPGDFTASAKAEAQAPGKVPISIVNGDQLVDLLIQYHVGVKDVPYTVPELDEEYWSEIVGLTPAEERIWGEKDVKVEIKNPGREFPLAVRATHKSQTYTAQLLDINGSMRFNGQNYPTPTTAAKVITTDWKQVNGWDFWRYLNPETNKWEKIGKLK